MSPTKTLLLYTLVAAPPDKYGIGEKQRGCRRSFSTAAGRELEIRIEGGLHGPFKRLKLPAKLI